MDHLQSFFLVARVLYIYLIEKLKCFWHVLLYHRPETMSFRPSLSKNEGDDKPLLFNLMCFTTFVVFLNGSQSLLCVLVLVMLNVTTKASFCPQ